MTNLFNVSRATIWRDIKYLRNENKMVVASCGSL
jgi:DeoR/GlpR family transcriptional regulator of sugar metabolism